MKNKIFIGGLSYDTSEDMLKAELDKCGKVISIRIVTDSKTGKSKGFGFATFENEEQAKNAIQMFDNTILHGRRIGVKEAIERR